MTTSARGITISLGILRGRTSRLSGDLLDFDKLDSQFKKHKPEVVVHLAANPDVMKGLSNTKLDLEQGTMATYNVLEASRRSDIDDIFFSSSSVIYGDSKVKPTRRSTDL